MVLGALLPLEDSSLPMNRKTLILNQKSSKNWIQGCPQDPHYDC